MAIGIHELRHAAGHLAPVFRSPLLPIFGVVTGLEALIVLSLPDATTDVVASMLGGSLLGIFDLGASVIAVLGMVLLMLALDLFRASLWGGLRRIALQHEVLSPGDVVREAFSRMGALFVTQQIIGAVTLVVSALCLIVGVAVQLIPQAIVSFTLAPALYAIVALRRPIGHSLSQAVRVTRRNFIAVYSVQTALLALAYWISSYFQSIDVAPMVGGYAAITLLMVYRFASFFGMGTLFLALDEAGEFER